MIFWYAFSPRLRFMMTFMKSSRNPSNPYPSVAAAAILPTFEGENAMTEIEAASKNAMPPIVGVPLFPSCLST